MEKRGRVAPAPSNLAPQQPAGGPRKERRPSMFEKEAVTDNSEVPKHKKNLDTEFNQYKFLIACNRRSQNLRLPKIENSYAQILRERLKESFHDVQYVEPPFDDSIADIGKEWKSVLAKLRFANSYRMEPLKKFQAYAVEAKVQQLLKESLKDVKYDDKAFSHLSLELADRILTVVKEFGYYRYKFIIKVLFIQKAGQAINVASRWIWDVAWDSWVAAKHETETYVALALVFALYCE